MSFEEFACTYSYRGYVGNMEQLSILERGEKVTPVFVEVQEQEVAMKECPWCKTKKPLTDFHNNKASADGRMYVCRECLLIQHRAWRATPEGKAKHNAEERKRYAANIDRSRALSRRANRKSTSLNPIRIKWKQFNKRSVKNGETPIPLADYEREYKKRNDRCCYCGCITPGLTGDHYLAKSNGGEHSISNIAFCCSHCNCVKGTRTTEWLQWRLEHEFFTKYPANRKHTIFNGHPYLAACPDG